MPQSPSGDRGPSSYQIERTPQSNRVTRRASATAPATVFIISDTRLLVPASIKLLTLPPRGDLVAIYVAPGRSPGRTPLALRPNRPHPGAREGRKRPLVNLQTGRGFAPATLAGARE
jgi:hypothetical protein